MTLPYSSWDAEDLKCVSSGAIKFLVLAVLSLSGCASTSGSSKATDPAASPKTPKVAPAPKPAASVVLADKPIVKKKPNPAEETVVASLTTGNDGVRGENAGRKINEADYDVVGFSEHDVVLLFGAPELITQKPPAVVWDYPSRNCRLSLFFYKDVNRDTFRVLTYEVEPSAVKADVCIAELQNGAG